MKYRQAIKILKNWNRFCYTRKQVYNALHTCLHRKNQYGVRTRGLVSERVFRSMAWTFSKDYQIAQQQRQIELEKYNV